MPEDICPICGGSDFRFLFQKDGHGHERCAGCRLIRINPQPGDEELEAIYNNAKTSYYESWGREEDVYARMKCLTFERLLAMLPPPGKQGLRLLDIGAATGILMRVAQAKGYEVYGIEASRPGAEAISRRFGPDRVFNGYFSEDFSHWPGLGFDVVCLVDLLEHIRRPDLVLAKIHRLLNDGGRLVICTMDASSFSAQLLGRHWPYYIPQHLYSFSMRNIRELLHNQGYALERLERAAKYLNLEYAVNGLKSCGQLKCLVKMLDLVRDLLPQSLRRRLVSLPVGQMALTAQKVRR